MEPKKLAEFVGIKQSSIYKWNRAKEEGGAYPSYEVTKLLFSLVATVEEIFDVPYIAQKQAQEPVPQALTIDSVNALIQQALERDRLDRSKAIGQVKTAS